MEVEIKDVIENVKQKNAKLSEIVKLGIFKIISNLESGLGVTLLGMSYMYCKRYTMENTDNLKEIMGRLQVYTTNIIGIVRLKN